MKATDELVWRTLHLLARLEQNVHGRGGCSLAATRRSLDLTGISKALEVVRPSDRIRSVLNTVILGVRSRTYTGWVGEDVKRP